MGNTHLAFAERVRGSMLEDLLSSSISQKARMLAAHLLPFMWQFVWTQAGQALGLLCANQQPRLYALSPQLPARDSERGQSAFLLNLCAWDTFSMSIFLANLLAWNLDFTWNRIPGLHSSGAWMRAAIGFTACACLHACRQNFLNLPPYLLGQTVGIALWCLNSCSSPVGIKPNVYINFMNQTSVFAVFQQNILFGTNSDRLQRCLGAAGCR